METAFKERFLQKWSKYFPGADLPVGFYYSDSADQKIIAKPPKAHRCLIGDLAKVRKGKNLCFDINAIGCFGGKRYCGFADKLAPNFEYFLSYGIPGQLEGERYKKTPELVKMLIKQQQPAQAPGKYIIFKRWDHMEKEDMPLVLIFFAPPDIISGLFTLANFDSTQPHGVIAPFGAGCASIIDYPLKELKEVEPRAVLGMFDVSARPCVPSSALTFAVPWPRLIKMLDNMDESFLITSSWKKVRARIKTRLSGNPG